MESDVIVEGLNLNVKTHGLRYLKYVDNGESSVCKNQRKKKMTYFMTAL